MYPIRGVQHVIIYIENQKHSEKKTGAKQCSNYKNTFYKDLYNSLSLYLVSQLIDLERVDILLKVRQYSLNPPFVSRSTSDRVEVYPFGTWVRRK